MIPSPDTIRATGSLRRNGEGSTSRRVQRAGDGVGESRQDEPLEQVPPRRVYRGYEGFGNQRMCIHRHQQERDRYAVLGSRRYAHVVANHESPIKSEREF